MDDTAEWSSSSSSETKPTPAQGTRMRTDSREGRMRDAECGVCYLEIEVFEGHLRSVFAVDGTGKKGEGDKGLAEAACCCIRLHHRPPIVRL